MLPSSLLTAILFLVWEYMIKDRVAKDSAEERSLSKDWRVLRQRREYFGRKVIFAFSGLCPSLPPGSHHISYSGTKTPNRLKDRRAPSAEFAGG